MTKNYEFANISNVAVEEINELQAKLSKDGKEVVLIAFEKKYEVAELTDSELAKINALEKELSTDKDIVLIAFSK